MIGNSELKGLRLPPGLHRFEIARSGFVAYRIELNLGEKMERLRVELKSMASRGP